MKKRILIVEDDLATRMLLDHVLAEEFLLTMVANGNEALEWLHQGNLVDLILTDLDMPHMSGIELMFKLQTFPLLEQIPIIVLSAQPSEELQKLRANTMIKSVLSKPFHYKSLLWDIQEVLALKQAV